MLNLEENLPRAFVQELTAFVQFVVENPAKPLLSIEDFTALDIACLLEQLAGSASEYFDFCQRMRVTPRLLGLLESTHLLPYFEGPWNP